MKSPTYKKYDSGDYFDYEFDCQEDFKQFLQEARKNSCQESIKNEAIENVGTKGELQGKKKIKKTWKYSLFSWLKADKKNTSVVQQSPRNGTVISEARRRPFSGPIHGSGGGRGGGDVGGGGRPWKPTSGPITSLLSSGKRVVEVPYVSLGQLNNVQSYGPVYLVT